MFKRIQVVIVGVILGAMGCKPAGSDSDATTSSTIDRTTVTALRLRNTGPVIVRQFSSKSIRQGVVCTIDAASSGVTLPIVPAAKFRVIAGGISDYFIVFPTPLPSESCEGDTWQFDRRTFFVDGQNVDLMSDGSVLSDTEVPADPSDLTSRKADALARNIEQRRSGGGKACGLTSFGQRGCWACVGWSMTDVGVFPRGLGSGADMSPNGFLRATASMRARKSADGIVTINGTRFRSLLAEFGMRPSLAPRGSILFCNTSAEGHAAVITKPANEMRSDVVEVIGSSWRQSLCWSKVDEILFPVD